MTKGHRSLNVNVPVDGLHFGSYTRPAAHEATHVKVSVYFDAGGISYYDYKIYPKGFYLSLTPIKVEHGHHFTSEISTLGSGGKVFLAPATRYNAKALAKIAAPLLAKAEALATFFRAGNAAALYESTGAIPMDAKSLGAA